ncbi:MAG: translocation/assembly module TamB domain-containing protein, partial [Candidatus Krumholzibacteriota bacterium]
HGLRYLTARLDTLDIDMPGIRVKASGELEPDEVELEFVGQVTDLHLPSQLTGQAMGEMEIDLGIDAAVAGSLEEPEVDARLGGSVHGDGIAIPEFDFSLEGDRRDVAAFLRAGGGLEFQGTRLDSVRAEVSGELAALDSLTAAFALAAWQRDHHLALGGSVQGDSVRVVHLDSLVTEAFGRRMRTSGPVTLTLGPGPETFELTELEFTGDPGTVTAQGFWNEEGMDLSAGVDLLLEEELLQLVAPSPLWSIKGGADLKLDASAGLADSGENPEVTGRTRAVLQPHRDEPPFGVVLEFSSRGGADAVLEADFSLTSADTALLAAQLVWPGKAGSQAGFWNPDPEKDLVLTVPSQKLDLERVNRRLPSEVVLDGEFDIAAEVHVFPPGKRVPEADTLSASGPRGTVEATLGTPDLRIDLPNRSWLETVVGASVAGPLDDPKIEAKVEVTSGFIRIPELPRNLHPVEGSSLLWALNDSIAAAMDSAMTDSLARAATTPDSQAIFIVPDQTGPVLDPAGPVALPELDLEVVLTDDLRIIGYGADIKLIGGVKVGRGYDEDNEPGPSISGEIRVHEGTLKVMNRVFDVERGGIKFTEAVPPNPNLDMMLETQVGTYLVRILISGNAAGPVIELTSEPDLTEEDIMAVLLFGQPLNDLDSDQRGRMQEENDPSRELQKNLAGLAMAFGTKGLQDSMSDSFGVDMVQMGSDSEGGSTLMVGKFITPDIMLKYHQSLEKSGTYFMTLEYSLNRYFKVISTYGQGEEASGAELHWSKRY